MNTQKHKYLINSIKTIISQARSLTARSVNSLQVASNYMVGKRIVEFEQGGSERAEYGKTLVGNRIWSRVFTEQSGVYAKILSDVFKTCRSKIPDRVWGIQFRLGNGEIPDSVWEIRFESWVIRYGTRDCAGTETTV